ncbi:glutathione S-transferase family protein [Leptolyngbyaceae cyanobacterium UHCC 1019]
MYRLYDFLPSGNGYKIRLLLTQLGIPFERIEVNILQGESRSLEFLAKNPSGRIPVLEIESSVFLSESNAVLLYLSEGTPFLPTDHLQRTRLYEWLFWEQNIHEPAIASSRFWIQHLNVAADRKDELQRRHRLGNEALALMEKHLSTQRFLVGDCYTIADIALFAYTHVADEGGFKLSQFRAIQAWIERIKAQPNHIPITYSNFQSFPPPTK